MTEPAAKPTPATWDPQAPLARMTGETAKQNQAINDYALLGAGRSLTKLLDHWARRPDPEPSPTDRLRTLKLWSSRNHWQARIAAWQDHQNEAERLAWAERSKKARLDNWRAAEAGQALVLETLIEQAPRLVRSTRREVRQADGSIREIVTIGLDANAISRLGDYVLKAQEAALQTNRKAAGTEEDPVHTVALSLADWKAQQAERRASALETLAEFGEQPEKETGGNRGSL